MLDLSKDIQDKLHANKILLKSIAPMLKLANPNLSTCSKCNLPWNCCTSKTVMYSENSGTFACCVNCWNESTLDELKSYWTKVYNKQKISLSKLPGNYKIEHTLEHMLKCVEREFNK